MWITGFPTMWITEYKAGSLNIKSESLHLKLRTLTFKLSETWLLFTSGICEKKVFGVWIIEFNVQWTSNRADFNGRRTSIWLMRSTRQQPVRSWHWMSEAFPGAHLFTQRFICFDTIEFVPKITKRVCNRCSNGCNFRNLCIADLH